MSSPRWFSQIMMVAVAFALCGGPELLQAQIAQPSPTTTQQQQDATSPAPATSEQADPKPTAQQSSAQQGQQTASQPDQNVGTTPQSATPNPSQGPLQPAETNEQNTTQSAPQPSQKPAEQQQSEQAPAGAAAAAGIKTAGGAASRPAGTAIAPAKQHQTRSLLIKIGAIAAGAAALGAVYGLSRSSPSTPGTHASATGTGGR